MISGKGLAGWTAAFLPLAALSAFGQSGAGGAGGSREVAKVVSESSSRPGKKSNNATPASKAPASPSVTKLDPYAYEIGVEDELSIVVWREPELSGSAVVRPDGKITLPLINDIQVLGLKTTELQSLLTEKLKAFVNEPQVTVIVKAIKSRKVYLMGQVSKQGPYPITGRKTVLGLIAEAGGLGTFAKGNSIYVLREVGDKQIRIPFRYKKALAGEKNADVELFPGDVVVVP